MLPAELREGGGAATSALPGCATGGLGKLGGVDAVTAEVGTVFVSRAMVAPLPVLPPPFGTVFGLDAGVVPASVFFGIGASAPPPLDLAEGDVAGGAAATTGCVVPEVSCEGAGLGMG